MLKKLAFLFSWPFMAILMVLLIVVLAVATFVEASHGTQAAWAVVYGTHWFELLFILIGINLVGVLFRMKYFQRKRIVVLTFHLAFIFILAGAAITRFISYEGMMHIREGASSNVMVSDDAYIDMTLRSGGEVVEKSKKVQLTSLTPGSYRDVATVGGEKVKVRSLGYLTNVAEQYVEAPDGDALLELIVVGERQATASILSGTASSALGMSLGLNLADSAAMINFYSSDTGLIMLAPMPVTIMQMGSSDGWEYEARAPVPIEGGKLYAFGQFRMAMQNFLPSVKKELVQVEGGMGSHRGAAHLELTYRGMQSRILVPGMPRMVGETVSGNMGDLNYEFAYGSREIHLPFALFLKDFEVERYPGSQSPSGFASEVVLLDQEMGIQEERRIFMNNVLKHRGYRFYQSSYDNDELGTILSVNRDMTGTFVTYLGYFLLMAGMLLALFVSHTRFSAILKRTARGKSAVVLMLFLLLGGLGSLRAQDVPPADIAKEFGKIWVQGRDGRFEPVNTLSNQVVRKVAGESHYGKYSHDQVLLGMILYPEQWQEKALFEIKHPELQRMTKHKGSVVSFNDLMDSTGRYLLSGLVNDAYSKQVAEQSQLDRELIKLDDKVNAMYLLQSGAMLKIFPDPGSDNHKWISVDQALQGQPGSRQDSLARLFLAYMGSIQHGQYEMTGQLLDQITSVQQQESILPSSSRKKMEIAYTKSRVFPSLARFYALFGVILMVLSFLLDLRPRKLYSFLYKVGVIHLAVAWLVHTIALGIRWYISGHAPMSNGYESVIFMSWVVLLAGLIFSKRSGYALAMGSILAALSLAVAGMSNMNPEITNLVPVLKSPWLTIHVAVIMAGYAFMFIASLLGLLSISIYASLNTGNKTKLEAIIKQLTRVNHLTLIIGLYFMTAGTFLGGVWANESWGRYWGWDPKETWALITVLIYAFVAHMHHIPGLKGRFAFNVASFFSFGSVLMTYFGVNYFLGGIHSYASGSAFKLPVWSYILVVALVALALYANNRQVKVLPRETEAETALE